MISQIDKTNTFDQWRQKTNLAIDSVNSLVDDVGDLDNLETTNKTTVVDAVNDVNDRINSLETLVVGKTTKILPLIIALS